MFAERNEGSAHDTIGDDLMMVGPKQEEDYSGDE